MKEKLAAACVIPVLVFDKAEYAVPTCEALVEGGLDVLEVTLRTDASWEAVNLIKKALPQANLGIGTVLERAQMERAKDQGVDFAVSPGFHPFLVSSAQELELFYLPGVVTPSEVMQVRSMGLTAIKFFPAQAAGGVSLLTSFVSPFRDIEFCPTGGVNEGNAIDYLSLPNVFCVGGSWVATAEDMEAGNWQAIREKAEAASKLGGN